MRNRFGQCGKSIPHFFEKPVCPGGAGSADNPNGADGKWIIMPKKVKISKKPHLYSKYILEYKTDPPGNGESGGDRTLSPMNPPKEERKRKVETIRNR